MNEATATTTPDSHSFEVTTTTEDPPIIDRVQTLEKGGEFKNLTLDYGRADEHQGLVFGVVLD